MKKLFTEPMIEVIHITSNDIITASPGCGKPDETEPI